MGMCPTLKISTWQLFSLGNKTTCCQKCQASYFDEFILRGIVCMTLKLLKLITKSWRWKIIKSLYLKGVAMVVWWILRSLYEWQICYNSTDHCLISAKFLKMVKNPISSQTHECGKMSKHRPLENLMKPFDVEVWKLVDMSDSPRSTKQSLDAMA